MPTREEKMAQLRAELAWYDSDEAMQLFKTGRMMYPEVTVACLEKQLKSLKEEG